MKEHISTVFTASKNIKFCYLCCPLVNSKKDDEWINDMCYKKDRWAHDQNICTLHQESLIHMHSEDSSATSFFDNESFLFPTKNSDIYCLHNELKKRMRNKPSNIYSECANHILKREAMDDLCNMKNDLFELKTPKSKKHKRHSFISVETKRTYRLRTPEKKKRENKASSPMAIQSFLGPFDDFADNQSFHQFGDEDIINSLPSQHNIATPILNWIE